MGRGQMGITIQILSAYSPFFIVFLFVNHKSKSKFFLLSFLLLKVIFLLLVSITLLFIRPSQNFNIWLSFGLSYK